MSARSSARASAHASARHRLAAGVTALALAWLLAPAPHAAAQGTSSGRDALPFPPELMRVRMAPVDEAPRFSHPLPPLSPAQSDRLRRAMDLRLSGLPDRARDTLALLLREAPHHPLAVTELARVHVARTDWNAVVTLGRAERLANHDSLLVSRELSLAFERLGRVREAAQIAAESWLVSPREAPWAQPRLMLLASGDSRGVIEVLRAAAARGIGRPDLSATLAVVLSHAGQPAEAARVLAAADRRSYNPPLRQRFADEALANSLSADSSSAIEALVSLAADSTMLRGPRVSAAVRAFGAVTGAPQAALAPRLAAALTDVPAAQWGHDLLTDLARTLRESGRSAQARALLERDPALAARVPELSFERLLARLREGPPAAVVPAFDSLAARWKSATFMLAEAEFFAGALDSALAHYDKVARDPASGDQLAALERYYLLDEDHADGALQALSRQAYAAWRGDAPLARAIADSLHRALPRTSKYYASAAMAASDARVSARDLPGALAAALAVADSLPDDRLAPVARARAGDVLMRQGNARGALAQFEECLARYPRAWNAPEVRRRVERLRKETRL